MAMTWELDVEAVEQTRAQRHGRTRHRREDRRASDDAVTIQRSTNGEVSVGWALDRSRSGARLVALSSAPIYPGEIVTVTFGDEEDRLATVAWSRHENDAAVIGVALGSSPSGERVSAVRLGRMEPRGRE